MASLLRIPEGNVGSGNWIPLSLIKMQICTVNEGSNLETIWPGQVSHQLLSSVRRLGVECTATQDTSGPASKEELFTLEEDIACRNSPFTASPVVVVGEAHQAPASSYPPAGSV